MRRRKLLRKVLTGTAMYAAAAVPYGLSWLLAPGRPAALLALVVIGLSSPSGAEAHHVLGRPAYSLNEDSNTPPSMQAEVRVGNYLLTYMVFPAFPRPGRPGRINFYAIGMDDGTPFEGKVTFKVRVVPWYSWLGFEGHENLLGVQPADDKVFRQGFVIPEPGDYIISAEFFAEGEIYVADFPLRVGEPPVIGPIGILGGVLFVVLILASVIHRRRSMTGKIRATRSRPK